jgi:hypothetical protein
MKKIDFRIYIIIVFSIILGVMIYFYFKDDTSNSFNNFSDFIKNNSTKTKNTTKNTTIVTSSAQITSALSEKLNLHATYYFKKTYYSENEIIKKGKKILKYTNGKYLYAPYDLVITSINVPSSNKEVTNEHYISVSSVNVFQVKIKVSESKIDKIYLGQSASIKVGALEDAKYEGVVTKISSSASNGKFTVTIEFQNDSRVLIGMSSEVTI